MPDDALPTPYQQYIHQSKYSRWRDDLGRRETWGETVDRYLDFWEERQADLVGPERARLRQAIVSLDALPSMRGLMTAGPALAENECAIYNCSFLTISRPEAFDEALLLLMCGVGVGYSVERRHISKLPSVPLTFEEDAETIVVGDSKYGWTTALRKIVKSLYAGKIPRWDTSKVRPAGTILRTFGGRASGPAPLEALFKHVVDVIIKARGRQLTSLEVHSICCKIGDIVVVGGVRRSAMISLFDDDDREMRFAKSGSWSEVHPHFQMANNSAVYETTPTPAQFLYDFSSLVRSQSGEPGIFNRKGAQAQAAKWSKRTYSIDYGTNPCGEIILKDRSFCNLSQITVRGRDTRQQLLDKLEIATILGTLQSTLVDFKHLSPEWKRNCEEERLLGVSMTGNPDHALLNGSRGKARLATFLEEAREHVWDVNADWAARLGINPAAAATCLKPAGNTSQLTGAASALKAWHSHQYVRRTRGSKNDPVSQLLIDQGVPYEDEAWHPDTTVVFEWPQQAPSGAKVMTDWSALDQLELWLVYRDHWCDHNPSVTVNVADDEWPDVASWVWKNWSKMTGITFLPQDGGMYVQAPYEELDKDNFATLVSRSPSDIDWSKLSDYELDDRTESSRELACSAGVCAL